MAHSKVLRFLDVWPCNPEQVQLPLPGCCEVPKRLLASLTTQIWDHLPLPPRVKAFKKAIREDAKRMAYYILLRHRVNHEMLELRAMEGPLEIQFPPSWDERGNHPKVVELFKQLIRLGKLTPSVSGHFDSKDISREFKVMFPDQKLPAKWARTANLILGYVQENGDPYEAAPARTDGCNRFYGYTLSSNDGDNDDDDNEPGSSLLPPRPPAIKCVIDAVILNDEAQLRHFMTLQQYFPPDLKICLQDIHTEEPYALYVRHLSNFTYTYIDPEDIGVIDYFVASEVAAGMSDRTELLDILIENAHSCHGYSMEGSMWILLNCASEKNQLATFKHLLIKYGVDLWELEYQEFWESDFRGFGNIEAVNFIQLFCD
jgi:hypothetical protein